MTTTNSDALVLFGVTGDLAHKMIFPALYSMVKHICENLLQISAARVVSAII